MKHAHYLNPVGYDAVKYYVVRKVSQHEKPNIGRILVRKALDRTELRMAGEAYALPISGLDNAVGRLRIVLGDIDPDGIKIFEGFPREEVFTHELFVD